jgi:hypothetical protein
MSLTASASAAARSAGSASTSTCAGLPPRTANTASTSGGVIDTTLLHTTLTDQGAIVDLDDAAVPVTTPH